MVLEYLSAFIMIESHSSLSGAQNVDTPTGCRWSKNDSIVDFSHDRDGRRIFMAEWI